MRISESFVQVYLHTFPCGQQQYCRHSAYVYMYKKENKMHMFTYTKFEAICIALRIHKKKLPAVLRTAALTAAALQAAEMYIFTCIHFFTTHNQYANSSGQHQRAQNKKCIHYIYTKYLFFMSKKCIHYIYTRNHTSSRQQPFQRPLHYSPTPQTCRQQAEI